MALITLLDAQLAFGHVALLDHASFSLEANERVGLIGRRESALRDTAGGHRDALVLPCDVSDAGAVDAAFDRLLGDAASA